MWATAPVRMAVSLIREDQECCLLITNLQNVSIFSSSFYTGRAAINHLGKNQEASNVHAKDSAGLPCGAFFALFETGFRKRVGEEDETIQTHVV